MLPLFLAALISAIWPITALAAAFDPLLKTSGNYAVLAAATTTNTGPSWITGHLALSPGSSATIGASTMFVGTILANTSITMVTAATLNGRAFAGLIAGSGALTLDTNRIIQPGGCAGGFTTFYNPPAYVGPPAGNILPAT